MGGEISRRTKAELLAVVRRRYREASKREKSRILDEFVAVVGCHRKHAVRLLKDGVASASAKQVVSRRVYDEAVKEALIVLWEAADRICGKRLKAVLPALVEALERHGHLRLNEEVRRRLLSASAATIDRLLAPVRGIRRRGQRRPVSGVSRQVPVRTFSDWGEPRPGFLEIDFVAHCGGSMAGAFLHSLVATDVASGWTEAVPLLAREQSLAVQGLEVISRRLPVAILGIDSDNDGAFINETLLAYCQQRQIEFTRSRAYRKNDQAWIEQKNGAVIRRFVGHERYAGAVAGQALAHLYQSVRLYVNYFQPSFKLREKTREGSRVKRLYFRPLTPAERLLGHAAVAETVKESLRRERAQLDPLALLHEIRQAQAALAALGSSAAGAGPERESLDRFLAELPRLWQLGEVRPTHRRGPCRPRDWRTRKDPFEGVWPEVLSWLQHEPEATAKSLFERLERQSPGQFAAGQLRTLQRRVRAWRQVMARKLVYAGLDESEAHEAVVIGEAGAGGC